MKQQEIRNFSSQYTIEKRALDDGGEVYHLHGLAVTFEQMSQFLWNDYGFYEIIHRGAITDETIKANDIYLTFNHDANKVLGRSRFGEGSLQLTVTEQGVEVDCDLDPLNPLTNEVVSHINRGEMIGMSFAFYGAEDYTSVDDQMNEIRHITSIKYLFDVSVVFEPAYLSSTVGLDIATRSIDNFHKEEQEKREKEQQEKQEELKAYYEDLEKQIPEC